MALLGDDPLEPSLAGRLEEGATVADDVIADLYPVVVADDRPQPSLALLERDVDQAGAVEVQQVERLVDDAPIRGRTARPSDPLLEKAEVGSPCSSSATTSPSMMASSAASHVGGDRNAPKYAGRILPTACPQPHLAAGDARLDPKPVPFGLEQPVGIVERLAHERREHRLDVQVVRRHRSSCHSASDRLHGRISCARGNGPGAGPLDDFSQRLVLTISSVAFAPLRRACRNAAGDGRELSARCRPGRW